MPTRSRTLTWKRDINNHFDTTFDIRSALKKLWTRISNVTAATMTLILSSASYPSAFLFGNFPHGSYSQNSCQRRFRTSFTTLRLSHSRSDARERITQAIRPSSFLKGPSRRLVPHIKFARPRESLLLRARTSISFQRSLFRRRPWNFPDYRVPGMS